MSGWQLDDERDGARDKSQSQRAAFWRPRVFAGQAIIFFVIASAVYVKWQQSVPETTRTAVTGGASAAQTLAAPAAASVEVPPDVSLVGRRFLAALAQGQLDEASKEVESSQSPKLAGEDRLKSAAAPFAATKARGFRVQYWQPSAGLEPARLVVGFDYDRPDSADARSRVTLRLVEQRGRWYVVDVDFGAWMVDLGLMR